MSAPAAPQARYLGQATPGSIPAEELDLWPAPDVDQVELHTTELQAVCPVTGQPDLYDLTLTYEPTGMIVESKALKLYLNGFRDVGITAEGLCARIADELHAKLQCPVCVTTEQRARGAITITSTAVRK